MIARLRTLVLSTLLVQAMVVHSQVSDIPSTLVTPEVSTFFATEEGKQFLHSVMESQRLEYEANSSDPLLASFYKLFAQNNLDAAFKAIQPPANSGHPQAQTELAYLYLSGSGTKQDVDEAIKWYRSASEKNNAMATATLAGIYATPQFGKQDIPRAIDLYEKCASKLRPTCVVGLAAMYARNGDSEINLPKAYAWATLGADLKFAGADMMIAEVKPKLSSAAMQAAAKEQASILKKLFGK